MFKQARIKLTAWYLLIIMVISLFFSGAIYRVLTFELNRVERVHRLRIERGFPERPRPMLIEPSLIAETKNHLKLTLTVINLAILGTSAIAGYFLAGQTLKPIGQMLEDQNRFIADASHELRTPLTSLKSEIEVNLRNKKLTLAEAKKTLESNLEEVNNIQTLSDRLIKSNQYQTNGNGLVFSQISSAVVVLKAIKKVASMAKNKQITINKKIADIQFAGNQEALIEMLTILLDNAIKYSPKDTSVSLTCRKSDNHVIVQIADQGIGISRQDMPHIFNRFYRTDKSRSKSNIPGYGLGLSIAKQIIDQHHGSVKVKSSLGKGSVFTIKLPK